jgi:NAD(P)-dependent dehydrogenase (short-subunit alcohol dehydrogenase family)
LSICPGREDLDLELRRKSVLITGASKGIGLACVRGFAAEGANVHLAAARIRSLG